VLVGERGAEPTQQGRDLLGELGDPRIEPGDVTGRLDQPGEVDPVSRRDLLSVFLRNDADIADEIVREVFERNLGITVNPTTVTVEVRDGVVTLRGEFERKSMIPIAETLTAGSTAS
jgi:hypothetical protein